MKAYKPTSGLPRAEYVPIGLIVLMFAIGSFAFSHVPDRIPSHWNAKGEIDGYSSKAVGLFLMPAIALVLYLGLSFIPYIAAYNDKVRSFHFLMYIVKIILVGFLLALYIIALLPALGISLDMNLALLPLFSLLVFGMGTVIGMAKRNYFIGIRTPWTLASDEVWDRTHKLGAKGFKAIALILLLSFFFIDYFVFLMIILLLGFSAFLVLYSYRLHRRLNKKMRD